MNFFVVDILTPSKTLLKNCPAESLIVPTKEGQITVLPHHTHYIGQLETGILSVFGGSDDPDHHFTVTTGAIKILENKVTILSDVAEPSASIDKERAIRSLERALEKLFDTSGLSLEEIEKFQRKIERAKLRLQILETYSKK